VSCAAGAAVTIAWCASMAAMSGMPMPGGWTMSMAWMRLPGRTWFAAAASFLGQARSRLEDEIRTAGGLGVSR
jgi:hypothetical protein